MLVQNGGAMIGYLISELYNARQNALKVHLKSLSPGINCTEFSILCHLYFRGDLKLGELEPVILVNKSNITRMVKSLKDKLLLSTISSHEDKRVVIITLTDAQKLWIKAKLLPITEQINGLFNQQQQQTITEMIHIFKEDKNETINYRC